MSTKLEPIKLNKVSPAVKDEAKAEPKMKFLVRRLPDGAEYDPDLKIEDGEVLRSDVIACLDDLTRSSKSGSSESGSSESGSSESRSSEEFEKKVKAVVLLSELLAGPDVDEVDEGLCERICAALSLPTVLNLTEGLSLDNEERSEWLSYIKYHREIIKCIMMLQMYHTDIMIKYCESMLGYMIECTDSSELVISSTACKFWSSLSFQPKLLQSDSLSSWITSLRAQLDKLVPALLSCMVYRDDHAQFLLNDPCRAVPGAMSRSGEQLKSKSTDGAEGGKKEDIRKASAENRCGCEGTEENSRCERDEATSHDDDDREERNYFLTAHADLRNMAAVSFENISKIMGEDVADTLMPHLLHFFINPPGGGEGEEEGKLTGWKQREALMLALSAHTAVVGTCRVMRRYYGDLLGRVLEAFTDPHPLVRSSACFTAQKFLNKTLPADVKDPTPRVIQQCLELLQDEYAEVRCIAVRCLAYVLSRVEINLEPFLSKMIDSLVSANHAMFGTPTRSAYFECIAHLMGRAGAEMSQYDTDRLIDPIIAQWRRYEAFCDEDDDDDDDDVDPTILCHTMCGLASNISAHKFQGYADLVFAKCTEQLRKMIAAVKSVNQMIEERKTGENVPDKAGGKAEAVVKSEASSELSSRVEINVASLSNEELREVYLPSKFVTYHMVGCMEVLCAAFDGLAESCGDLSLMYGLTSLVRDVLSTSDLHDSVHQGALALLGHVARFYRIDPAGDKARHDPSTAVNKKSLTSSDTQEHSENKNDKKSISCEPNAEPNPGDFVDVVVEKIQHLISVYSRSSCGDAQRAAGDVAACGMESSCSNEKSHPSREKTSKKGTHQDEGQPSKSRKQNVDVSSEDTRLSKPLSELSLVDKLGASAGEVESVVTSGNRSMLSSLSWREGHAESQCNALWALVFLSRHPSSNRLKLLSVLDDLVLIMKDVRGHGGCVSNAAWALTSICAQWPECTAAVVLGKDVLLHLLGLIESHDPATVEIRFEILVNLSKALLPLVERVKPVELWGQFVATVATAERLREAKESWGTESWKETGERMRVAVRALLHELKARLSPTAWNTVLKDAGKVESSLVRKAYELY